MLTQAVNIGGLTSLFRKEFELCRVKRGETVVLLERPEYIARVYRGIVRGRDRPWRRQLQHHGRADHTTGIASTAQVREAAKA